MLSEKRCLKTAAAQKAAMNEISHLSAAELAALVQEALRKVSVEVVLSGGSCVVCGARMPILVMTSI